MTRPRCKSYIAPVLALHSAYSSIQTWSPRQTSVGVPIYSVTFYTPRPWFLCCCSINSCFCALKHRLQLPPRAMFFCCRPLSFRYIIYAYYIYVSGARKVCWGGRRRATPAEHEQNIHQLACTRREPWFRQHEGNTFVLVLKFIFKPQNLMMIYMISYSENLFLLSRSEGLLEAHPTFFGGDKKHLDLVCCTIFNSKRFNKLLLEKLIEIHESNRAN